jgi:hypothetical protein
MNIVGFCFIFLLLVAAAPTSAGEFRPAGWAQPYLYGAARYADETVDFDRTIPGPETRREKFATINGGRVFRYSYNNKVFAYDVDGDAEDPLDYTIVDFDGSGLFEIKQSPYDEYPLPFWTQQ